MNSIGKGGTRLLKLEEVGNDELWDSILNKSSQTSVYLHSNFLHSVNLSSFRYLLFQDGIPKIGCVLPLQNSNLSLSPLAYCMYQGLFFVEEIRNSYSDDISRLELLSLLAKEIVELQNSTTLSVHHSVNDIRGFEWYFFGKELPYKITYETKYTGLIDLQSYSDFESYKKTTRYSRRRECQKIERDEVFKLEESNDVELFMNLYRKMFAQKEILIGNVSLNRVATIIQEGIGCGYGKLKILFNENGDAFSGIYILSDARTDYYQFGATDPNKKEMHGSTYLIFDAIESAFSASKHFFDIVGMNSPARGDFKASFNARVKPYFEIQFIGN